MVTEQQQAPNWTGEYTFPKYRWNILKDRIHVIKQMHFNECLKDKMIQNTFYDYNEIKLEIGGKTGISMGN